MMIYKLITLLIAVTLLLAGCVTQTATQAPEPTPDGASQPAYPGPEVVTPEEPSAYPGPSDPDPGAYPGVQPVLPMPTYVPPSSSESTGGGDEDKQPVYLELDQSELLLMESYPVQVAMILRGNLPDPCHELRYIVSPPDFENKVRVEVYSIRGEAEMCAAVLEPFESRIDLGSFAGGHFSVYVNGELLGEFDA
jgi:hypothetical protein